MASLSTDFIIATARAYRDLPEDEHGSDYGHGFLAGQAETAYHLAERLGEEEMAFFVGNVAELIAAVAARDLDAYRRANPHAVEVPGDNEFHPHFPATVPLAAPSSARTGTVTVTADTPTIETIVESLNDGDVFSLDGGQTWYVCGFVMFGTVSVWASERRDDNAPLLSIYAERDDPVLVVTH